MESNGFAPILISVTLTVLVFLVFREIICWYWKINQSVSLLTEIRDLLKKMENSDSKPIDNRAFELTGKTLNNLSQKTVSTDSDVHK